MKEEKIKKVVREGYARIAKEQSSCCGSPATQKSKTRGYTDAELKAVPEGADLGLGCGNPVAMASLKEGDIVLDLGSGAGIDCFLAAHKVGKNGRIIGVDMTPEMIEKARENASKGNYTNVEFRLGEIENLPVADSSVDVIISNCVLNLVPDKKRAFSEAFRVLKPSGRLMVSDIVLLQELPEFIKQSIQAYVGCLSGAIMKDDYLKGLRTAGFKDVEILSEAEFPLDHITNDPTARAIMENSNIPMEKVREMSGKVLSIKVRGIKPQG
ncbi:MAG: arsenite methyltransferase [Chloroflexota bacterium]|nr:arsenite methyltransferase [Chloroflexota bacterium]